MSIPSGLTIAQLLATPGTNWGGMEKHTAELSDELACRGHSVHVIAHHDYQRRFSDAITFHALPVGLGRRNPWLTFRLKQTLRKLQPAIVHAQGNKAATLLSGIKKQQWNTVGTIHGTKSNHRAYLRLNGVIAVSKGIEQALTHPNSTVIHNGISPPATDDKTNIPLPEAKDFALALGRLEPVKQFGKLIEAWATLNPPLPLYILGDGSETGRLKAKIASLGMEHTIKLPGLEKNPSAWLRRASVIVVSSKREGFPYALVEALQAGCPVLSTPVNGALDLLPGTCLAESTSLKDMQSLLARWLPDTVTLKKVQEVCFERARKELTVSAMSRHTEDFYYQLISKTPDG